VYVQWNPERTIRGKSLAIKSIQVGLSQHIVRNYVNDLMIKIEDMTPLVRKIYALFQEGLETKARALLPEEHVYPLDSLLARRIGIR